MTRKVAQLAPLKHQIFRAIWFASLASNLGGLIQSVGAAWLMTSIGASRGEIALVQASTTLPIMIFSLLAGAIADNFDRRRLMLLSQLFLFSVSVLLTLFSSLGHMTPWLLLFFTFLVGCGNAFNGPAWQSLVGEMVPRSDLSAAISLNAMGFNLARSVGPAIGGFIVAAFGATTAFAMNAISYVGLLTVLMRWKPTAQTQSLPPERLGTAMIAGVRYVAMSPRIGLVLIRGAMFGLAGITVQALMPLIARDLVEGGPLTYGLLLCAFGLGAVGGAIASTRLREALSIEGVVRLAFLGSAFCAGLASVSSMLVFTLVASLAGGASWVMAMSSFNASVQLSAPRWVVGRVLALYQMATFGGMALGSWLWGMVAENIGTREALEGSAVLLLVGAAIGLRLRLPDMQPLADHPTTEWAEPELAEPIDPSRGPVVVTIEFKIRDADLPAFLAAMEERRRVRMRNGARHWALLRDLAQTNVWTERYDTPTWLDYVRQNRRMTQSDRELGKALRDLHQGTEPPRIRRMVEERAGGAT